MPDIPDSQELLDRGKRNVLGILRVIGIMNTGLGLHVLISERVIRLLFEKKESIMIFN